jgi:hypothetical protein
LHGVLDKINRLGLFLILVAQIKDNNHCPECGQVQIQQPIEE